ncbi:MAG: HAD family hydrolase [Pseudomonas sp.]|uniref:HAD family hydrolase n=1 Tax=Pseudomonas sp. TaxID=306 RepID=UPI0030F218C5
MSIQLITFDLDDTLWDNLPVITGAEAAMRSWLSEHAPLLGALPVEHLWAIRTQVLAAEPTLRYRLSELRKRTLFQAMEGVGYSAEESTRMAEQAFHAMLDARHRITFFDDTVPTLERLTERYTLGVITNGNADVRRLGLADYFRFALCAEDLGVGKPDPLPFLTALQHAGVEAHAGVHVGDHPADDIRGAQNAGMRAIWFNPQGKSWEGEGQPDAEIRALAELPGVLEQWS